MPSPSRSRPVRLLGLGVMSPSLGRPAAGPAGSSPVGPGCGWSLTNSSPRFLCGEASRVRGVPCLHPLVSQCCRRCLQCVAPRRPLPCEAVAQSWRGWLRSIRRCGPPGCDVAPCRRRTGQAAPLGVLARASPSHPARGRRRRRRCAPRRGCGFFVAVLRSLPRPSCSPGGHGLGGPRHGGCAGACGYHHDGGSSRSVPVGHRRGERDRGRPGDGCPDRRAQRPEGNHHPCRADA